MFKSNLFFRPILIFIFSLIALGTSLFLYIHWYLEVNHTLQEFISQYHLDADKILRSETWVIILTLSILVAIIMSGIALIFVYYNMMISLYRQQQNFINGFTHELKTPIASLKLYLETFKKHDLPRVDQQKYLDYMMVDVDRLSYNVHRILNLAKIEDKRQITEFTIHDIYQFIVNGLEKNSHLFEKSNVQVTKTEGKDYYFPINPPLFEMLVSNLVSNGLAYNESETPSLTIGLDIVSDNMVIKFSDNGVGVEESELKKIFKKFYQIKKPAKGSGLGLFLVQSITKLHKGSIKVESEGEGSGSTFIVTLPMKAEFNN